MSDRNDLLATLRHRRLTRDDEIDPAGRVYFDESGRQYHSITRILSTTKPEHQQRALEKWLERPSSAQDRDIAATRGTLTHNHAEYLLKTANRLARSTSNKRGTWRLGDDGLYRSPSAIYKWALDKAAAGAPSVSWSAAGYARSLRAWILENMTFAHAIEFSVLHPAGFAGTCDCLGRIRGEGPILIDWKTTSSRNPDFHSYRHQLGAYSLGLKHLTGLQAAGAAIVCARRTGAPIVEEMGLEALLEAEEAFMERVERHFSALGRSAA